MNHEGDQVLLMKIETDLQKSVHVVKTNEAVPEQTLKLAVVVRLPLLHQGDRKYPALSFVLNESIQIHLVTFKS